MKYGNDIAVVGMSCRLPGARNVDEYWTNLCAGAMSLSRVSQDELLAAGLSPELLRDPSFVPVQGVMPDAYAFDAAFFGVNPREAQVIDPQQRVFLECASAALEQAACDPQRFRGAIGVYGGCGATFHLNRVLEHPDVVATVGEQMVRWGNSTDFLTTRVSYKLGLRGPSVAVQTACSTSLVAIHLACQSLLNRECDLALAGGVTVVPERLKGYHFQPDGILSRDGRCRTFDAHASGTVFASGAGVVALKRMDDAVRDGDAVHAVIKGSAINNDGGSKIGYTAPSAIGQAAAITEALAVADVDPSTIGYVETHGTATPLGDPIEIAALKEAFGAVDHRNGCALGAVKTNIGHVDCAAGVAGFIKAVLALEHGVVPPTLHFETANPALGLADSPFFVNSAMRQWPRTTTPRRAGVSAFGIGGTNAHVVLEEAPARTPSRSTREPQMLVLSAKTDAALERMRGNLASHLRARAAELSLSDVAFTLQEGRTAYQCRWVAVVSDFEDACQALSQSVLVRATSASSELARLEAICSQWMAGEEIDWTAVRGNERWQRVPLPTYPFERVEHRLPIALTSRPSTLVTRPATQSAPSPQDASRIDDRVTALFARLIGTEPCDLDARVSFVELGADSLILMQASELIEKEFGVTVSFRRMLDDVATIDELSDYLEASLPSIVR
jgi:acyl transferase domain-containing protein